MMDLGNLLKQILGEKYRPRDDEFVSPDIKIWFLRRREKAKEQTTSLPFQIETQTRPNPKFYKAIYKAVGGPWMWWERIAMSDGNIDKLFASDERLLVLPMIEGEAAGFSEIHFISPEVSEITYFGFKPGFTGRGFGKVFMEEIVRLAFVDGVQEIQLNTCTLDSPHARAFYKTVGFEEYDTKSGPVHIPRHLLDAELISGR